MFMPARGVGDPIRRLPVSPMRPTRPIGSPVQRVLGGRGRLPFSPIERMQPMAEPVMFKKGGKVKKTGWAKVHKGERVIPAGAAARSMGGKKKKVPKTKRAKTKVKRVLGEFKNGKLKSSSGQKVTNRRQGVAIALSEARRNA